MSGRIFTFYSWKGGAGRTMAVANVGVQLARRGKRVLLVDWDLEAPGLDRFFEHAGEAGASVEPPADRTGLLGLLTDAAAQPSQTLEPDLWRRRCARITLPKLPDPPGAHAAVPKPEPLSLLAAGLHSPDYAIRLQAFAWPAFFAAEDGAGGRWLEALRVQWQEAFDAVLIDSRTGLTDSGGVCTVQLPDTLVLVFTANTQCLEDGLAFLAGVHRTRAAFAFERAPLTVVPFLARWEGDREVDLADSWLERMTPVVAPLVETWLPKTFPVRRMLERLRVPHVARFSFGEPLPVLTHSLSDPDRPGLAYDLLAELLANGFVDTGRVIDPGYRPAFDATRVTDEDLDSLILDDQARAAALRQAETDGTESSKLIALFLRLAQRIAEVGRLPLADELVQTAVSKARGHVALAPDDVRYAGLLARALRLLGDVRESLGRLPDAFLAYRESLTVSLRLAEADGSNVGWQYDISATEDRIGDILRAQGDLVGALSAYRRALTVSQRLTTSKPSIAYSQHGLAVSLLKVGDVLRDQGDLDGALTAYRHSLTIGRQLVEIDPANPNWQRTLGTIQDKVGDVLRDLGDLSRALAAYREALEGSRRLAEANPGQVSCQRALTVALVKSADVLRDQNDLEGALASYQESLTISHRLAGLDPSNTDRQRDLGVIHERIGDTFRKQGALDHALSANQQALAIGRRLTEADPSNAEWQRDLAVSLGKVGDVLGSQGNLDGALAHYRESHAMRRRLVETDPSNTTWQRDLGISQDRIATVLLSQGDQEGALAAFHEALAISRTLAEAAPSNAGWQRDLSVSLTDVATLLESRGEPAAALPFAEESLSIDERLAALDATNVRWRHDLAVSQELVARLRAAVSAGANASAVDSDSAAEEAT